MARISIDIEIFSRKLMNRDFVDHAPKAVVEKENAMPTESMEKFKKLEQGFKML